MVTKACVSSSYCYEKGAGMKDKAYNERLEKSYEQQRSVQVNWDQDKKTLNNNIIAKMHPCSSGYSLCWCLTNAYEKIP